jgi:hypothetical protein
LNVPAVPAAPAEESPADGVPVVMPTANRRAQIQEIGTSSR